jgi:hypothetical protein
VDGCRIGRDPDDTSGWSETGSNQSENRAMSGNNYARAPKPDASGRWPANVVLDEAAAAALDAMSGDRPSGGTGEGGSGHRVGLRGNILDRTINNPRTSDTGGASRFFYTAKASRSERGEGNTHPTVKPVSLMRWLVRLVTPPGGTVLDPFCGSGSTGVAALQEGFRFIGIEREAEYAQIAERRLADATGENEPQLPLLKVERTPRPPRPKQFALFEMEREW